jgi:hypothetical protein
MLMVMVFCILSTGSTVAFLFSFHTECCPVGALLSSRFWVTERRMYQERLQEEQKATADTSDLAAKVAEQDNAIRAAKGRILTLRSQVRTTLHMCTHPQPGDLQYGWQLLHAEA